jgi:hypothetical protein
MAWNWCVRPALVPSPCIEQVVAGLDFSPPLDQLQRPQPAQRVVETAVVGFIAGLDRYVLFGGRIGLCLGKHFQNQPLCFLQPAAPVVDQSRACRKRLLRAEHSFQPST